MARRYGNAGNVSSLVSSARSAYEKTQAIQDQIASIDWDNSAKTAEDADRYKSYLASRAKTYEQTDPMKYNTLQQKIVTTNRAFVNADISRQSDQVNQGNMTNTQKYYAMIQFANTAADNGDLNLAQRLSERANTLSMTIQREGEARAAAGVASSKQAYDNLKGGINDQITELDKARQVNEYNVRNHLITKADYINARVDLANQKAATLNDAAAGKLGALKPSDISAFQKDIVAHLNSDEYRKFGGKQGDAIKRDPSLLTQKVDGSFDATPISGYRQLTIKDVKDGNGLGVFQPIPTNVTDQNSGKMAQDAFKKAGFNLGSSAVKNGSATVTTIDPQTKEQRQIQVFIDQKSGKAYTVDPNTGLKQSVNPKDNSLGFMIDTPDGSIFPAAATKSNEQSKKDAAWFGASGVMRRFGNEFKGISGSKSASNFERTLQGIPIIGDLQHGLTNLLEAKKLEAAKKEAQAQAQAAAFKQQLAQTQAQHNAVIAEQQRNAANKQAFTAAPVYNPTTGTLSNALGPRNPAYYAPEAVKQSKTVTGVVNKALGIKY